MTDDDMERTTVRMPSYLLALVKAEATRSGRSVNGEILFRLRQSYAESVDYAGLPPPSLDTSRVAEDSPGYRELVQEWVREEVKRQVAELVDAAVEERLRARGVREQAEE